MKKTKIMMLCGMAAVLASCGGGTDIKGYAVTDDLEYIPFVDVNDCLVYVNPDNGEVNDKLTGDPYTTNSLFHEGYTFGDGGRVYSLFVNKQGVQLGGENAYYSSATAFNEGLAWVTPEDSCLRVIDTNGEVQFTFQQAERAYAFNEGMAVFINAEDRYGIVDKNGEVVVVPRWTEVVPVVVDGLIAVKDGNGFGLYDINEEKMLITGMETVGVDFDRIDKSVYDPNFSFYRNYIDAIKQGRIPVENKGDKWGIIDKEGKYVINPQFSEIIPDGDGYAFRNGDTWGWCDSEGKYVINPQFGDVRPFNGRDLTPAFDDGADLWGLIDREGRWQVNPQFGRIDPFMPNGLAIAFDNTTEAYGLINDEGEWVVNPQFKELVYFGNNDRLIARDDSYLAGLIDMEGTYIVNPKYSDYISDIKYNLSGYGCNTAAYSQYVDVDAYVNAIGQMLEKLNSLQTAGDLKQAFGLEERAFSKYGGIDGYIYSNKLKGLAASVSVLRVNAWNRTRSGWSYKYTFNPDVMLDGNFTLSVYFPGGFRVSERQASVIEKFKSKYGYDPETKYINVQGLRSVKMTYDEDSPVSMRNEIVFTVDRGDDTD